MNSQSKLFFLLIWLVSFIVGVQANSDSRTSGSLSFSRSSYLSESPTLNQRGDFSYISADLQQSLTGAQSKFVMKANGLFAPGSETERYFAVPELYYQIGSQNPDVLQKRTFSIGRKIETWSEFDEQWKLGLWQPLARWDYIHPETQGLIGLFFDVRANSLIRVSAAYTPLFVPDQGPGFKLKDGQFESDNRWFLAPQQNIDLNGVASPTFYTIDRPRTWDVVNQQGGAVKIEVGNFDQGTWVRTSYANMPSNQLHIGIDPGQGVSKTFLAIHPMVVRHELAALESGFRWEKSAIMASYTIDNPTKPDLPATWEESILRKTRFLGLSFEHKLPMGPIKQSTAKVHYLKRWDDASRTGEGVIGDQVESSLDRFPYEEMMGFEWSARLWNSVRRDLRLGFKYLYSVPEKGALLTSFLHLKTSREWQWDLSFDVIGAPGSGTRGLMGRYRSNDRVVGGVSYVF